MLKPTNVEAHEPLVVKMEEDLAMCKTQLEACTTQKPGVTNSLIRDSKKAVDQIEKNSSTKTDAIPH